MEDMNMAQNLEKMKEEMQWEMAPAPDQQNVPADNWQHVSYVTAPALHWPSEHKISYSFTFTFKISCQSLLWQF